MDNKVNCDGLLTDVGRSLSHFTILQSPGLQARSDPDKSCCSAKVTHRFDDYLLALMAAKKGLSPLARRVDFSPVTTGDEGADSTSDKSARGRK